MRHSALLHCRDLKLISDVSNDSATTLITVSNLGLTEAIQLACLHRIEVNWECEGDDEAAERDNHGDVVTSLVCKQTCERREKRATADGSDNPGRAALGVATETTKRQGQNCREDARFEKEDERQTGNATLAPDIYRADGEDHDHGREQ